MLHIIILHGLSAFFTPGWILQSDLRGRLLIMPFFSHIAPHSQLADMHGLPSGSGWCKTYSYSYLYRMSSV